MFTTYQSVYKHHLTDDDLRDCDDYKLDHDIFKTPSDDFVMCRDAAGVPTAIYGKVVWNFKPFSTSQTGQYQLNFNIFKQSSTLTDAEQLTLIAEIKKIIFLLIYFLPDMGRSGLMSVKILGKRFQNLKDIALYSEKIKSRFSVSNNMIGHVLSNELFMADYISTLSENKKSELSDLLINLKRIDKRYLGYDLITFYQARADVDQTAIIPSRIYLQTFSILKSEIDRYWDAKDNLTNFLKEFVERDVGNAVTTQRKNGRKNNFLPSLQALIIRHNLDSFFIDDYAIKDKRNLVKILINMQTTCKFYIHQYTAMRNEEVLRIKYNCIKNVDIFESKLEQVSKLRSKKFIGLISTTTKLSGYFREVSWLAPDAINKGIDVLQAIVKGIAHILNCSADDLPLFQTVTFITRRNNNAGTTLSTCKVKPLCLRKSLITADDRQELINSDKNRDFSEKEFQVGQPWAFKSHQFRRSLGFFGANSGLVSESTGAELFKHLNHEMQRYYRRGYNKIRSILGSFNKDTGEIDLPDDHFLFEFQTGIAIDKAREMLNLLFEDNEALFGKRGSYIERQRQDIKDDEVKILEFRAETERKLLQGEISFKKTLIGGCMKEGRCEDYMLGDLTACLDCSDAITQLSKIEKTITQMENELSSYEPESGEYQFTNLELEQLKVFQDKEIKKRECNE